MAPREGLKQMCSERYIKVKRVFLTTRGSVCGEVCACPCVCIGTSVWQTLGHIEGPGDVPWAPANRSEGNPLHNRPAWDLAGIKPIPAWYRGKPALATVGDAGPAVSQLGFIQTGKCALRGQKSLHGQGDQPLLAS